mgnify:CR=1 FL=1
MSVSHHTGAPKFKLNQEETACLAEIPCAYVNLRFDKSCMP